MRVNSLLLGIFALIGHSIQDSAPLPPSPDKILTPNSSNAPAGCKLLASDRGFPNEATVRAEIPNAVFKQPGTKGPDWTILAKNVQDVQRGVQFASKHNVRLTVITRGHDFGGREDARSGLRIDMSAFDEPTVFATSWRCGDTLRPAQSPHNTIRPVAGQQAVARVSASMYAEKFYEQADKSGLFVMTAQHGGVSSIGGWAQGGGHNPFAHEYGMMTDQILEYEVVTPDGKFQKVSDCNNQELFWALRGGGGSTFGVVTAATVKVYPTIPIVVARFFVNSTSPRLWDAVAYFLQQGPGLRDAHGVQGYFYVYHNAFQSVLHMPGQFATEQNARNAIEPLLNQMNQLAGARPQPAKYYSYRTFKAWMAAENGNHEMEDRKFKFLSWYDGSDGSAPGQAQAFENPLSLIPWAIKNPQGPTKRSVPLDDMQYEFGDVSLEHVKRDSVAPGSLKRAMSRTYLDSRLLSEKHVKSVSQAQLAKIMNNTMPGITNNHIRGFLYGGGKQAQPAPNAMGLNPAWRTMSYHIIINAVPGDIRRDYDVSAMKRAFPDAGAYANEASPGEANWKNVYWGSNYGRLEQIKRKYDPKNVLWCSPCIGADMLTYDDERICTNSRYPASGPAPQTYVDMKSRTGIASLPGSPGIANPLGPIIQQYLKDGTLPKSVPNFPQVQAPADAGHAHGEAAPAPAAASGNNNLASLLGQLTGGGAPASAPAAASNNNNLASILGQLTGGGASAPAAAASNNNNLASILGQLTGGGASAPAAASNNNNLASILGQISGGGASAPAAASNNNNLASILGQLTGGGASAPAAASNNNNLASILGQLTGGGASAPAAASNNNNLASILGQLTGGAAPAAANNNDLASALGQLVGGLRGS